MAAMEVGVIDSLEHVDRDVVDARPASDREGNGEMETEKNTSILMDDYGGGDVDVDAAVATAEDDSERDMEEEGGVRVDSLGRKKRKERENGSTNLEDDDEEKEERKKRRDEKEKRKSRDRQEGSAKREHRDGRDRKESKRKKDRKDKKDKKEKKEKKERKEKKDKTERREEKDLKIGKGTDEEGNSEVLKGGGNDGKLEVKAGDNISRDNSVEDVDVGSRRTVSVIASGYGKKDPLSVDSNKKSSLPMDDDKEEGEIVDEEAGLALVAESEAESGEIQGMDENAMLSEYTGVVVVSAQDSLGRVDSSRWNSSPAQAASALSEYATLPRIGRSPIEHGVEKASQSTPANPLQSMLVIAEAYDSESPASEDKHGIQSSGRSESRRHYNKVANGSRRSELPGSDRRSDGEVVRLKDKVEAKRLSAGALERRSIKHKEKRNITDIDEDMSGMDDILKISNRGEGRSASPSDWRRKAQEQFVLDRPKSRVIRHSDSPEREDSGQAGGNRGDESRRRRSPTPRETARGKDSRRGRSPSPKEAIREKDHSRYQSASPKEVVRGKDLRRGRSRSPKEITREREQKRGRSRSKERRTERLRSKSPGSVRGRDSHRRRSRSPEIPREKSSRTARSLSRESPRGGRRIERRKRSPSRDSGLEQRQTRADSIDRRRRSRSRESARLRSSGRGHGFDRRRRSRSRDSKDRHRDRSRIADELDSRRRSRSRSIRDRRVEDRRTSLDRRRRSRSKDSLRDHRVDERDRARYGRHADDLSHRSSRDDRAFHDQLRPNEGGRNNASRMDRDRDRERDRDRYQSGADNKNRPRNDKQDKASAMASEAVREEENEEYQERVALQLAAQQEDDVDRVKEESRRRRQAILEKYKKQQQKPSVVETLPGSDHAANGIVAAEKEAVPLASVSLRQASPVSILSSDKSLPLGKTAAQNGTLPPPTRTEAGVLGAGSPKSERSADIFSDDIFGESPAGGRRLGRGDGVAMDTSGLIDNWDDAEGYYCFRIGEVLDGRYEVASSHGRGVFSTVVRARDTRPLKGDPEEVAIKIIRNNETMYKAGQQELVILKKLAGADPENKRHCVRLISSFEYRSHLCLVFESLHMNLREIIKKFGRNIGINLNAVQAYAKQLFISLKHLRNCGVLHCDIKPDNMLVNESKNVLKLCDFGSAMFAGENEITPYLVSRFYRAPEIILGLPYDHALDIWSVGCCLYELYTGKMLFQGHTNNDMLRLHMELKGQFPKKMLRKASFTDQHFDQDFNFCAIEEDPVTKKAIKRIMMNMKQKDMGLLISGSGEDSKTLASFKDLLEKIFILDPDKRLTVSQALSHPFISGK